jgi:hypothetical protein
LHHKNFKQWLRVMAAHIAAIGLSASPSYTFCETYSEFGIAGHEFTTNKKGVSTCIIKTSNNC